MNNIKNLKFMKLILPIFFILGVYVTPSFAQEVNINLVAVNPFDYIKEVDLKHYLPEEVTPDDIIDKGQFLMDYDVNKGAYYVHGKVKFKPKESRTFKLRVKDVWVIKEDEILLMKDQLEKNLTLLDPTKDNIGAAERTVTYLMGQIDHIYGQQINYSENINRRIEEYRAYRDNLEDIRDQVFSVDFLRHDAKALEELRDLESTVKLRIEVENPSKDKPRTVKHKHYLPKEIRAEHVIDNKGFEIRFEESKNKAYLIKEDTFKAGEKKSFTIILKDIWNFPVIKLSDLKDRAMIADGELDGTIFQTSSNFLFERIQKTLDEIRMTEETSADLPTQEHIGMFRANEARYESAWKDFKRIEEMIAIVRAKKLEKFESGKVKNVLQKLKALRGLSALSEALFKKGLSITVTWRIIFGTIIFVGLFTTAHFLLWSKRSKHMGEELADTSGEGIKEVPKPGDEEKEEEDEE